MPDGNTASAVIQELRSAARDAAPGTRLPSVRELMARHRASPLTVQRAVARLAAEGLVEARPGSGTFAVARGAAAAPSATRAPDLSWQAVALGARAAGGDEALQDLLAVPPAGAIALSGGYPQAELSPPARSAPRSRAPRGDRGRGSAGRSRAASRCARGSPARPAARSPPTTWWSARAASPR